MTLAIDAEDEVAGVLLRWVRVPAHVHPDCTCGEAEALMCSTPDADGFWIPLGLRPPDMPRAEYLDCMEVGDLGFDYSTRCVATAFGVRWEDLSVLALRGMFALLASIEGPTLDVLATIEPERLAELRRTCKQPADAVRALRLMRDHAGRQ